MSPPIQRSRICKVRMTGEDRLHSLWRHEMRGFDTRDLICPVGDRRCERSRASMGMIWRCSTMGSVAVRYNGIQLWRTATRLCFLDRLGVRLGHITRRIRSSSSRRKGLDGQSSTRIRETIKYLSPLYPYHVFRLPLIVLGSSAFLCGQASVRPIRELRHSISTIVLLPNFVAPSTRFCCPFDAFLHPV